MSYIEGFVLAVPTANKDSFIAHAQTADQVFLEHGATRILECWGEDVPRGERTDFWKAVAASEAETVVFSWMEWPDKTTRDSQMAKLEEVMREDPRFDPQTNPMPFDGTRMIYGGFQTIAEHGESSRNSYVRAHVVSVPESGGEVYRRRADESASRIVDYGARRILHAWQDDVPPGRQTDFFRAVKAEPHERIAISIVEWPSRELYETAARKMPTDPRLNRPEAETPFDEMRMILAGFVPVVELGA